MFLPLWNSRCFSGRPEPPIVVRKLGFLKRHLDEGAMGFAAVVRRSLLDNPNSLLSGW